MTEHLGKHALRRRFSFRGLITYLVLLSFLVMLVSGVVNFLAPSGRISREIDWTLLGLDRVGWQTLHLSFATVFVAAGLVHIGFNWKGLLHYLRDRASHHLTLKWEAVVALLIAIWLATSAVLAFPPVSNLHDLNTHFRQTFWTDGSRPGRTTNFPSSNAASEELPAAAGSSLPPNHPPVPSDKACSNCHR